MKGGHGRKSKAQVEEARKDYYSAYNRLTQEQRKDMLTYIVTSNVGSTYTFWKDGKLSNKDAVFVFERETEALENYFLTKDS